jgi:hypothetical protein
MATGVSAFVALGVGVEVESLRARKPITAITSTMMIVTHETPPLLGSTTVGVAPDVTLVDPPFGQPWMS